MDNFQLPEQGIEDAKEFLKIFRNEVNDVLNDSISKVLSNVYCELLPHIETDAWSNFRGSILDYFNAYQKLSTSEAFRIRQIIYRDNFEKINSDILFDVKSKFEKEILVHKTNYEELKKEFSILRNNFQDKVFLKKRIEYLESLESED